MGSMGMALGPWPLAWCWAEKLVGMGETLDFRLQICRLAPSVDERANRIQQPLASVQPMFLN